MRATGIAVMGVGLCALGIVGCGADGRAPQPVTAEGYLTPQDELRPIEREPGRKLQVVATTSVLADVVHQVGGEAVELTTLIPAGVDPHAFEPTPQAARELAAADVVFISGFGLEEFMADLLVQAGGEANVVSASLGIEPVAAADLHLGEDAARPTPGGGDSADSRFVDPHTWFDPNNVVHWTGNIEAALAAVDPENAEVYAQNAAAYREQLVALDAEIRQAVAEVPPAERRLVTDHEELAYFADEYGFEIVGSVLPSTSSLAEPSAQDLGALFDKIRAEGVPAIFVTAGSNDALASRLAEDAGVRLVTLYGHSLTGPEGPAPSYLDLMRYNARTIAEALMP